MNDSLYKYLSKTIIWIGNFVMHFSMSCVLLQLKTLFLKGETYKIKRTKQKKAFELMINSEDANKGHDKTRQDTKMVKDEVYCNLCLFCCCVCLAVRSTVESRYMFVQPWGEMIVCYNNNKRKEEEESRNLLNFKLYTQRALQIFESNIIFVLFL